MRHGYDFNDHYRSYLLPSHAWHLYKPSYLPNQIPSESFDISASHPSLLYHPVQSLQVQCLCQPRTSMTAEANRSNGERAPHSDHGSLHPYPPAQQAPQLHCFDRVQHRIAFEGHSGNEADEILLLRSDLEQGRDVG